MGSVRPINPGLEALLQTISRLQAQAVAVPARAAGAEKTPPVDRVELSAAAVQTKTETPAGS